MEYNDEYVDQLRNVLQFLQDHGFNKAADAVYEQLDAKEPSEPEQLVEDPEPSSQASDRESSDDGDASGSDVKAAYRSKSAEPVLTSHEDLDPVAASDTPGPWQPGAACTLSRRLSGASRLYEDPDIDEYEGMDDCGYLRRPISRQQDFVRYQLGMIPSDDSELLGLHDEHQGSPTASLSSSASLSSPGFDKRSSPTSGPDHTQLPDQKSSPSASCPDDPWDNGPAGITLAAPVSTPTKDSRRSSTSDFKPSLSRVESLSNSFIDDLEGLDCTSAPLSDAGSVAGDAEDCCQSGCEVVDLQPSSGPSHNYGASNDSYPGIFDLGLKVLASRTASTEVLHGSIAGLSDGGSEWSAEQHQQWSAAGRKQLMKSLAGTQAARQKADSKAEEVKRGASVGSSLVDIQAGGVEAVKETPLGLVVGAAAAGVVLTPEAPVASKEEPATGTAAAAAVVSPSEPETYIAAADTAEVPLQAEAAGGAASKTPAAAGAACSSGGGITQTAKPPADGKMEAASDLGAAKQDSKQEVSKADSADATAAHLVAPQPDIWIAGSPFTAPGAVVSIEVAPEAAAAPAEEAAAAAPAPAMKEQPLKVNTQPPPQPLLEQGSDPERVETPDVQADLSPGFGFSFPVTPPTDEEEHMLEARAERVFSTWASSHSRASFELGGASDEEDPVGENNQTHRRGKSLLQSAGSNKSQDLSGIDLQPFFSTPQSSLGGAGGGAGSTPGSRRGSARPSGCGALGNASRSGTGWLGAAASLEEVAAAEAAAGAALAAAVASRSGSMSGASPAGASCCSSVVKGSPGNSRGGAVGANSCSSSGRGGNRGSEQQKQHQQQAAVKLEQQQQQQSRQQDDCLSVDEAGLVEEAAGLVEEEVSAQDPWIEGPTELDDEGTGDNEEAEAGSSSRTGRRTQEEEASSIDTSYIEGPQPRYVIDESGNLLYEYDPDYINAKYEIFDLKVIHRRRRTGFEDSKEFAIRKNDLIAGRYQVMDFLGSAAFSQAVQALDVATGSLVCLKIIKNNKDYLDQSLDEIKLLRYVNAADPADEHGIVRLYDFFYFKEHLILVCELLRANLYEFQKYQRDNGDEPYFTLPRIQKIAIQVLRSLAFLHGLGLVHSDLKPENILIKSYSRCEVKVIDLGSSCFTTDHLSSYVQSRSYRAPEVILGLRYDTKVDIWSLGCILAELSTGYVLLQNDSICTLLARLEGIIGPMPSWMICQGRYGTRYYTRSRQLYERSRQSGRFELLLPKRSSLRHRVPDADEGFLDFLSYLLTIDPNERPTAEEALNHPWLQFPYPPVEPVQD